MMLADLGICNVELSGTKEKPIISTVHQLTDDSGEKKQYTLLLGQESVGNTTFLFQNRFVDGCVDSGAVLWWMNRSEYAPTAYPTSD